MEETLGLNLAKAGFQNLWSKVTNEGPKLFSNHLNYIVG